MRRTIWLVKWNPKTADFIEEGIRPLVVSLNQWKTVETVFSCEGHPGHKIFKIPYVEFMAGESDLKKLKKRLKGTGWGIFESKSRLHGERRSYLLKGSQGQSSEPVKEIAKLLEPEEPCPRWEACISEYRETKKRGVYRCLGW
jgi:hypothetical protein